MKAGTARVRPSKVRRAAPDVRQPFTIRPSRKSDLANLIRISMGAFRGPTAEDRWTAYYTKSPHLSWERILVAERDGAMLGSAALLDLRTRIDGRPVSMDGVAAVAVDLTARRQGVADRLLRACLTDARRRGVPASFLYAFRASFYRRFGYAPVEMGHVLHVRPRDLPDSPDRRYVRRYQDADFPAIERCYRAATAGATGPIERSDMWWKVRALREGQDRVVFDAGRGRVEGYVLGALAENASLGKRAFRVHELMASTRRARRGLMGWLATMADEFSTIEVSLPADGSWIPFLRDPHFPPVARSYFQQDPAGMAGWGCMGRITHLERALALRAPRPVKGSVVIHARDTIVPENDGAWTVRLGGPGTTSRVRPGALAKLALRGDMDVWTQVWLGAVSALGAWRFGFLEGDEEAARLLEAAWFGPAPFWGTLNEF